MKRYAGVSTWRLQTSFQRRQLRHFLSLLRFNRFYHSSRLSWSRQKNVCGDHDFYGHVDFWWSVYIWKWRLWSPCSFESGLLPRFHIIAPSSVRIVGLWKSPSHWTKILLFRWIMSIVKVGIVLVFEHAISDEIICDSLRMVVVVVALKHPSSARSLTGWWWWSGWWWFWTPLYDLPKRIITDGW